jgi:hypothetical protein
VVGSPLPGERDQATRRCAGDQVEVVADGHVKVVFEAREDVGREQPAQATPVEREDLDAVGVGHRLSSSYICR